MWPNKRPKIWLLTGIYLLKDATFAKEKKRTAGIQVGVSSTILSAVGAPPIGPSIDLGHSNNSSSQTPTQGWLVWAAQYRAIDYRVCTMASGTADIKLLDDVVSEGTAFLSGSEWSNGLMVEVTEQYHSRDDDDGAQPACDDDVYEKIEESFWMCRASGSLTRDESVDRSESESWTLEQEAKFNRWSEAKEELERTGSEASHLQSRACYPLRTQDGFEEEMQRAIDRYLVAEEEYKQAFADFKSSLGEQALKGNEMKV